MKIHKGGRPRKDGDRKPSGDLRPQVDYGSRYLLMRRAALIDPSIDTSKVIDVRDLAALQDQRASHLLGIMQAQQRITADMAWAGRRYAAAYNQSVARPSMRSGLEMMVATASGGYSGGEVIEETPDERELRLEDVRADYLAMRSCIFRHGRHVVAVVDRVAVFDEQIREAQVEPLRIGLRALHRWLEIRKGR